MNIDTGLLMVDVLILISKKQTGAPHSQYPLRSSNIESPRSPTPNVRESLQYFQIHAAACINSCSLQDFGSFSRKPLGG